MRRGIVEDILIGLSVLMGLVSAMIADTAGVPALKWLGIAMVVSAAVAIAVKCRGDRAVPAARAPSAAG